MPDEPKRASEDEQTAGWWSLAGIGFEFLAALLVPGAIGYWLDGKFNSRPWLMLVGGLLGFAIGLMQLLREAKKTFKS
jgi:ATP synthase protein I